MPFLSATSIKGLSWFGVDVMKSFSWSLTQSHAQPEPKRPIAAFLNSSLKLANEPQVSSIAAPNVLAGSPPPFGERIFQNKSWLKCPPPLLRTGAGYLLIFANNSFNE